MNAEFIGLRNFIKVGVTVYWSKYFDIAVFL